MAASARVKKHIPGQEELQMVQQCGPSQGDTAHTARVKVGWGGGEGEDVQYPGPHVDTRGIEVLEEVEEDESNGHQPHQHQAVQHPCWGRGRLRSC